jgi:hypothetical protein
MSPLRSLRPVALVLMLAFLLGTSGAGTSPSSALEKVSPSVQSLLNQALTALSTTVAPRALALLERANLPGVYTSSPEMGTAIANSGFAVLKGSATKPVSWNTCEPIRVAVNDRHAPAGAVEDLREALRRLSEATGVTWSLIGRTDERPSLVRDPGAPVLVTWERGETHDSYGHLVLGENDPGRGGPTYTDGHRTIGSGQAIFNANMDHTYTPGFGTGRTRGALLLHELGHVAGLGHVNDPNEIMLTYSAIRKDAAQFGAGDRAGLATLFANCTKGKTLSHDHAAH